MQNLKGTCSFIYLLIWQDLLDPKYIQNHVKLPMVTILTLLLTDLNHSLGGYKQN